MPLIIQSKATGVVVLAKSTAFELPGASIDGAAEVCERIRDAIESMTVRDRGQIIRCTVSLGFGSFPETPVEIGPGEGQQSLHPTR